MLQHSMNVEETIYNRSYISTLLGIQQKEGIMEETNGFVKMKLA